MKPPSETPKSASSTSSRKRKATAEEIEIDISASEPPSKKALRKERKRSSHKSENPLNEDAHSVSIEGNSKVSKDQQHSEKSSYGIWMGNLPFTATKDDIRKFLVENSSTKPGEITRVHIPTSRDSSSAPRPPRQAAKPQNKGFAYVDLSTAEALEASLSLSERLITGRRVLIKDAKSFEGRPDKPKDGAAGGSGVTCAKAPTNRIFIGNLGFDMTKEDLEEHFARCGEVDDVHVATFEDSGKCKGYAWVTFAEVEAAAAAMRGWVKVSPDEEEESTSDVKSDDDGIEGSRPKKVSKKPKIRKWWVNRMKGRPLRMEFAEDKAVRYKKRFGKDGTAQKRLQDFQHDFAEPEQTPADVTMSDAIPHSAGSLRPKTSSTPAKAGRSSIELSRLTGGLVDSQSKKTVFA